MMQLLTASVILLLCTLINVQQCGAQSCVMAGYTSCCNQNDDLDNCEGRPLGFCFCDPSCTEYGDCCEDLADVCNPEKDVLYASLEPQAVYTTSLSFQSAIVHWVSASYINNSHVGQSDLIYTLHLSTSSSVNTYSTSVITRLSNHTSHNEAYSMLLSGLEPSTNHSYHLTAMTWYGEIQFEISGDFKTLDPSSLCVGEIQVSVLTSSSIQVTWSPLPLLPGVTVVGHVIRYQELPLGQDVSLYINQSYNLYEMIGLREGVVYSFVVMAIISEESGRVLMTGECTRNEIFIPASQVLQLTAVGSFSAHCTRWEASDEEALVSSISTTIVSRIRESLDPNYPSSNIRDGYIICHATATNTPTHRLTYRARILATADISINRLLRLLQTWSSGSDSEFIIQHDTMLTTPLTTPILVLDHNCPVSVRTMAYPLCEAVDLSTSAGLESGCVSVPIFAASLVALCLFLVVVTMVIVVCILVWSQGKKTKYSVTDEARQGPSATSPLYNQYTLTPLDTMATRQLSNGRPLALRVTGSASSGPTSVQGCVASGEGVANVGVVSGELVREFNSSQSLEEETQSEPIVTTV